MIWFYRDFLDGALYIVIALLSLVFILAIIGFIMERLQLEKEEKNRVAVIQGEGTTGNNFNNVIRSELSNSSVKQSNPTEMNDVSVIAPESIDLACENDLSVSLDTNISQETVSIPEVVTSLESDNHISENVVISTENTEDSVIPAVVSESSFPNGSENELNTIQFEEMSHLPKESQEENPNDVKTSDAVSTQADITNDSSSGEMEAISQQVENRNIDLGKEHKDGDDGKSNEEQSMTVVIDTPVELTGVEIKETINDQDHSSEFKKEEGMIEKDGMGTDSAAVSSDQELGNIETSQVDEKSIETSEEISSN